MFQIVLQTINNTKATDQTAHINLPICFMRFSINHSKFNITSIFLYPAAKHFRVRINLSIWGTNLTVRGMSLSLRGINLSVRGNNLSSRGINLSMRGNDLSPRGTNLSVGGNDLSVRGTNLSVRGNDLSVRGTNLSVRGKDHSDLRTRVEHCLKICVNDKTVNSFQLLT